MNPGKTLKFLRTKNGLTQQQMAIRLRISRNAYIAWEKNQVELTVGRLEAVCRIFNISLCEFFLPEDAVPQHESPVSTLPVIKDILRERLYFLKEQSRELVRLNRKLARILERTLNSPKIHNLPEPFPSSDENPPGSRPVAFYINRFRAANAV